MRKQAWLRIAVAVATVVGIGACGGGGGSEFNPGPNDDGGGGGDDASFIDSGLGGDGGPTMPVASLTIDPPTATLDVSVAPFPTQQFTTTAHYVDGTSGIITPSWSASNTPVGNIVNTGLYKTRGTQGGAVTITATAGGKTATAALTVTFHLLENSASADAATQAGLLAATAPDAAVTWTYPYDATAFPRGLNAPQLMWNGAAAGDVYLVHIQSPTYELQAFTNAALATTLAGAAPAGGRTFAFAAATWGGFVDSTSGSATLTVSRKSGSTYTRLVQHTWAIASRSMSGSIYYWAINKAAVVRIKPGAIAPDYFLAAATVPPGPTTGTVMYCPSCHTASADGSTLVMGTGIWGSTVDVWSTLYNLKTSATSFNGYQTTNPATQFPLAAVTPDGKMVVENWATVRGSPMGQTDLPVDISAPVLATPTLPSVTGTNLETLVGASNHTFFPVFSADNALFAYVDSSSGALISLDWNPVTKKFANPRTLIAGGATKIAYPTISPDHRWVVYQRGPDYGSLNTSFTGDLYAVDTTKPGTEIALDGINNTYSAAAGVARDRHRSYEPTFAPVPSGGFFWLVFHSRRTFGNTLVDVPYVNGNEGTGTKQLWVAAINVPTAAPSTTDPSHAPFWLPGQDPTTRNMRGYWALDPCQPDGTSCVTGTDCCGGFCDGTNDAGVAVCGSTSTSCSQVGDRCNVTADCCGAAGVTCINHACAEPPPR